MATAAEIAERLPEQLYRYLAPTGARLERARQLIVDSVLYFAPPSAFNDPFDCRIPPHFDGPEADLRRRWELFGERHGIPIDERAQHVGRMLQLHRTPEGRSHMLQQYYKLLDTYGLACFATTPTSMLMWSYYGAGHTGLAVRFRTDLRFLQRIEGTWLPLPVAYADEMPAVSWSDGDRLNFVRSTLGTKAAAWKHEEEWRLVRVGANGPLALPAGMIDGVTLGLRTPPALEALVREWIQQSGRDIELSRIVPAAGTFTLDLEAA
jgi:hypothetical protein